MAAAQLGHRTCQAGECLPGGLVGRLVQRLRTAARRLTGAVSQNAASGAPLVTSPRIAGLQVNGNVGRTIGSFLYDFVIRISITDLLVEVASNRL